MCSLFPAVLHSPVMTNQAFSSDIRRYAIAGAKARVAEITQELDVIRRAFPELQQNGSSGAGTRQSAATGGDEPTTRTRRRRRTMTAAQRKAVGERMTRYWAARRGGSETTGTTSSDSTRENTSKTARGTVKRGPRNMSPEARKRISDAQKERWAKQRGTAATTPSGSKTSTKTVRSGKSKGNARSTSTRGPRKMSAAARKRISQAQKKRWAAKRKAA